MKLFDKNIYITFFSTNFCLFIILILLLVGDTLTKIYLNDILNFSWLFKALISILLLINLFISNKSLFWGISILFMSILLGIVFNYQNDVVAKTSLFFEYISGIMLFNFLLTNNKKESLKKGIFFVFSFYLTTIIFAALFDIVFLKTYGENRFGYKPIFSSQNEFSFIMIAIIAFFYKNYLTKKSFFNLILAIISVITALFIGTKVVYIFIIVFIIYLGLKHLKVNYLMLIILLSTLIIILNKESLFEIINNNYSPIVDIYYKTGFLDAISSLRLSYLKDRFPCQISSFEFINYLFGGLNMSCYTEMSIIDILLFFGLLGGPYYLYLYKKYIYNKLSLDSFGYVLIITTISLSFVAGAFFENLSAQFYLLSVLFIYYHNPHSSFQNKVEK